MARPIRSRLLISFLLVLLVGMSLVSVLVWRTAAQMYLDTQRENLLAQARLGAAALSGQPIPLQDSQPYLQTTNLAPGIHTRFLSDQGGTLISVPFAETEVTLPGTDPSLQVSAQELARRPEIQQALNGEAASAVRKVGSGSGRRVLYAAAPVRGLDGQVVGLVYLAAPLPAGGLPLKQVGQLTAALLAAVILAVLVALLLARRLAQPIEDVARAAAAVSQGDLEQKVAEDSRVAELDHLGAAFNAMTASLRQSQQLKNAFIADVTHELRTPLTVIKGTVETLEDGAVDDVAGRVPLLTAMHQETDRLIRLVNDLLLLTRADAGMLRMQPRSIDLAQLARARCEQFNLAAQRNDNCLVVQADETRPVWIEADPDRLAQVWDNLLDNALRYSPPGGVVVVYIERSGDEVLCTVRDQGPGIDSAHLERVFERFYRVDPARDRKLGGAGLGLAIVRALVAAHGGRAWAESQPGQGASLRFTLPLQARVSPPGLT